MNNLEKIEAAWKMGWSATLKHGVSYYQVVSIGKESIFLRSIKKNWVLEIENVEQSIDEITGYLYAGELAGKEIPEGQKFRVKEAGMIGIDTGNPWSKHVADIQDSESAIHTVDKSEIEPIFE